MSPRGFRLRDGMVSMFMQNKRNASGLLRNPNIIRTGS